MKNQVVAYNDSASAWEKALYAFLGRSSTLMDAMRGVLNAFAGVRTRSVVVLA